MNARKLTLLVGILTAFGALVLVGGRAYAAPEAKTFTVNYILDEPDGLAGDGKCESAPSAKCTLRAAVMEANAWDGADTIVLPANNQFVLTRPGDDHAGLYGDLDVVQDLTILGGGMYTTVIDGGSIDRIFEVHHGASQPVSFKLANVMLHHGKHAQTGGAIRSVNKEVILDHVYAYDNESDGSGGAFDLSAENILITDSYISNNSGFYGGAIAVSGKMTLLRTTVEYNKAQRSDGEWDRGGGFFVYNGTQLLVVDSAIMYNQAEDGGGIFNYGQVSSINSTLGANEALNYGGGINTYAGSAELFNTTLAQNIADKDADGNGDGGGIYVNNSGGAIVTLRNSILGNNIDKSPGGGAFGIFRPHNCKGTLTTQGYNLISNNHDCAGFTVNANGDLVGTTSGLIGARLAAWPTLNGGTTANYALLSDSPAIDSGNPNGCTDHEAQTLTRDQRGYIRPWNGGSSVRCDMGSHEYASEPPPPDACAGNPAAPTLLKPKTDGNVKSQTPKLDWEDVPCATKYKVLVRQDSKDGPRVFKKKGPASEAETTTLEKGHTHYWRVRACKEDLCTKSQWFKFYVKP